MFCSKCGKEIADGSRFCPECGAQFNVPPTPVEQSQSTVVGTRDQMQSTNLVYPKNPPVSPHVAWLSILWPGIPQMIHGQVSKGLVLVVLTVFSFLMPVITVGLIAASLVDAFKVGKVLASGTPVAKWAWFPNA
ncbi:zinc ribbon domain-containing protein [Candidatus Parcubacteria bacterium]|nr:MAG: zinc ribbon domain-containing protein [Candidatus Parcubacteria bacterium]